MARHFALAFTALLLLPVPGRAAALCDREAAAQPQQQQQRAKGDKKPEQSSRRPTKWWMEPKDRAELGINDQQSAAIEAIWQKSLKQRGETRDRLVKLEDALSRMMQDSAVDEAAVIAQIDKVEATRTEANKARVLLLFRMNRELTPDQRQKLEAKAKAMREQRDGGRRGGSSSR